MSVGVPEHPQKVKPPLNLVGDVNGRIAIMVVSIMSLGNTHIHNIIKFKTNPAIVLTI